MDPLENRVERLERQNRTLKLGAVLVLVVLGGVLLMGQAPQLNTSDELRARKFTLVDDAGKTRAALDMYEKEPRLVLFDEAGKGRIGLDMVENEPRLVLCDKAETMRVVLSVSQEQIREEPSLVLYDKKGRWKAIFSVSQSVTWDNGKLALRYNEGLSEQVWRAP